ncbi:tetratricopeptide repeat protein [Rhodothermus profundi]|uniref:Tetratricopeptide repeat-containing protein n=1 Tax=Rhodothermus profundi TaxID=633813 RepID=A0A1M6X8W6_9BACT|nr:tetratricopeptide repeat protein [Rhodothermus profundi]SHL02384.1 Tetratricopeptide repeat-containing protein [Rhodothermus profundi]
MSETVTQLEAAKSQLLLQRARAAHASSQFAEAARLYLAAARLLQKRPEQQAAALLEAAHALRLVGYFRRALQLYARVQALAHKVGDEALWMDARVGEGMARRAMGDLEAAITCFREALAYYEAQHDTEGIGYTLWCLGGALRLTGAFDEALDCLLEALAIFEDEAPSTAEGYVRCALGGLSRMRGAYDASLAYYQAAERILTACDDLFGRAYAACGMANAYRMLGEVEAAHHYFTQAQQRYHQIGDRVSYAYTLWGEGTLFKITHRLTQARERFRQALQLFRATGDDRGIAYAYTGLAELLLLEDRAPKQALRYLEAARERATRHGYTFERLHAELLLHLSGLKPVKGGIEALQEAYRRCGSQWLEGLPLALPLNIP